MKYTDIIKRCIYILFFVFPIEKRKIVFSNYYGQGFGDNCKYIAKEFLRHSNYKLIWLCSNDTKNNLPNGVIPIKKNSLVGLYHLATASAWVDNCRKPLWIIKRKKQYYVQTWHGCIALKKIEGDAEDLIDLHYIKAAKRESTYIDLMVSNSRTCSDMYRRAFWYKGEILECGSPRNDILFNYNTKLIERLKTKLYLTEDDIVILYAPTFRNNKSKAAYITNYYEIIHVFEKLTNKQIKLFIRLHPNMKEQSKYIRENKKIINVSSYPDMQELLIISDYIISDYSSTAIEFSMMKKPTFLYMNDYNEYISERGLFFKLSELPYMISFTEKELIEQIEHFNFIRYNDNLNKFFNKLQLKESGTAAKQVASKIQAVLDRKY